MTAIYLKKFKEFIDNKVSKKEVEKLVSKMGTVNADKRSRTFKTAYNKLLDLQEFMNESGHNSVIVRLKEQSFKKRIDAYFGESSDSHPIKKPTPKKPTPKKPTPKKPTPKKEAKILPFTPKKKVETQKKRLETGVLTKKISVIFTDENRFQGRKGLRKEVVNRIAENWSDADQDPVHIWRDPKTKKYFVLSGHHRLAAAKQAKKLAIKTIDRTKDFTEKEAIKFATEEANANRTLETPIERANTLRKKRLSGDSKQEIKQFLEKEGKNKVFVENLSFLNPKGALIQALVSFSETTDVENNILIEKIADWVGEARKRNEVLTDLHETELFNFLKDKNLSKRFTKKSDFLSKVNAITSELFFDKTKFLNIAKFQNKTEGENQYDSEVMQKKEDISKLEEKKAGLLDRFNNPKNPNYIKPSSQEYSLLTKRANKLIEIIESDLKTERQKLLDLYQNKGKFINAGSNQQALFGNNELSGVGLIPFSEQLKNNPKPNQTYKISGAISKLLGEVEIKQSGSVAVTIDAPQGAGKTTFAFQFIEEFAKNGYKCLFASLEEHKDSNIFKDKANRFLSPKAKENFYPVSDLEENFETLKKMIPFCDVIVIDSWNKLLEIDKTISFDNDLRKAFDGKLFLCIFQRTVSGSMRGGSSAGFDGDIILKTFKDEANFRNNYVYADKNRYNGNLVKYNIASKSIVKEDVSAS